MKLREVTNELHEVKTTCKQVCRENKALSCAIAGVGPGRGGKTRKGFSDLSRQRKSVGQSQAVVNIQAALSFLENDGLKATTVNVAEAANSQKMYFVDIQKSSFCSQSSIDNQNAHSNIHLDMVLYVKEKFNLSREAYHKLSMACRDLPCSSKVQKRVQELNKKRNISPCPANPGVQQSL